MNKDLGLMMKYFVLKPGGTDRHARASRAAMRRYAEVISEIDPDLGLQLLTWADTEFEFAYAERPASTRSFLEKAESGKFYENFSSTSDDGDLKAVRSARDVSESKGRSGDRKRRKNSQHGV